jgi:murein DD-endopeptidase MepM/ murein hydrolase activator NlpD
MILFSKKSKRITVQIIPEGTTKGHTITLRPFVFKLLTILLWLFIVGLLAVLVQLSSINKTLANAKFYEETNRKLIEKHKEYELAFEELDSIYSMETQIHNILQTYLESDSNKIASILDKNRFHHTPSQKTKIHFDYLYHQADSDTLKEMSAPDILPVIGTISNKYNAKENHQGIDFATPLNEPVFATANGTVKFMGDKGDLGLSLEIKHNETFETRYSHLGRVNVRKGDYVRKGEVIGFVGMTGRTTGSHLHYEVIRDGKNVDPSNYFNHN